MGRGARLFEAGSRSRHLDQAPEHLGPGPVRTCVGCRRKDLATLLVRVALADAGAGQPAVVVDLARRLPGRGAWLHPELRCLDLAERRRAFARALRFSGSVDSREVRAHVEMLEGHKTPGNSPGEA